ncbi:MAG: 50S ribosomal protein L28 [Bacteroidetes bacterium]|nr:50S ribosomal protein L28 [Bacteroidota bacterium]
MAKTCPITNKRVNVAGGYSNRVRATQFNPTGKRKQHVNIQKKRIYIPEIGKSVRISVSTQGIKTINKNGAYKTLKQAGII